MHEQYVHTLAMAYRPVPGIDSAVVIASIDHDVARALGEMASLRSASGGESGNIDPSVDEAVKAMAAQIRSRLDLLHHPLGDQISADPGVRVATFEGEGGSPVAILIPILNAQGKAWYAESPRENFDFTVEQAVGLLDG